MRGQRSSLRPAWPRPRIIPARAGPTSPVLRNHMTGTDHPRSCGANQSTKISHMFCLGSSPLVRGQLDDMYYHLLRERIIPARAGPTAKTFSSGPRPPDHPRSCGANRIFTREELRKAGSSPLVRGQPIDLTLKTPHPRIIPARAGPTFRAAGLDTEVTDHPRSCGANHRPCCIRRSDCGSSPLVRGQP